MGASYLNYILVLVHFGLIKKTNYISIPSTLHLLSAAGPVPHAEPILASLVLESSTSVSFSIDSNCRFDCSQFGS